MDELDRVLFEAVMVKQTKLKPEEVIKEQWATGRYFTWYDADTKTVSVRQLI